MKTLHQFAGCLRQSLITWLKRHALEGLINLPPDLAQGGTMRIWNKGVIRLANAIGASPYRSTLHDTLRQKCDHRRARRRLESAW